LITILIPAIDCLEPGARNSNLLPVNANGEVLFLSVVSFSISGSDSTPVSISLPASYLTPLPLFSWSTTAASWSPRYIEIIAGGASFAPSLWSLPAVATDTLSKSA